MPTVPLVALKKHSYGKGSLTPGQAFEAAERDAKILVQLGIAKRADVGAHPEQPIAKPPRQTPSPANTTAGEAAPVGTPHDVPIVSTETIVAEPMTTKSTTKRGTYKRRDLTAEGDE